MFKYIRKLTISRRIRESGLETIQLGMILNHITELLPWRTQYFSTQQFTAHNPGTRHRSLPLGPWRLLPLKARYLWLCSPEGVLCTTHVLFPCWSLTDVSGWWGTWVTCQHPNPKRGFFLREAHTHKMGTLQTKEGFSVILGSQTEWWLSTKAYRD